MVSVNSVDREALKRALERYEKTERKADVRISGLRVRKSTVSATVTMEDNGRIQTRRVRYELLAA